MLPIFFLVWADVLARILVKNAEFGNRPDVAEVREVVSAVVAKGAMIQNFGEAGIIIRTNEDTEGSREQVVKVLQEKYADMKVIGFEKVGPIVGRELRNQAVVGISIALVAILIYITVRFQFRFAVVSITGRPAESATRGPRQQRSGAGFPWRRRCGPAVR